MAVLPRVLLPHVCAQTVHGRPRAAPPSRDQLGSDMALTCGGTNIDARPGHLRARTVLLVSGRSSVRLRPRAQLIKA